MPEAAPATKPKIDRKRAAPARARAYPASPSQAAPAPAPRAKANAEGSVQIRAIQEPPASRRQSKTECDFLFEALITTARSSIAEPGSACHTIMIVYPCFRRANARCRQRWIEAWITSRFRNLM